MSRQVSIQKRFSLSNPKVLIAVIFILGFGIFGAYKVLSSSAATVAPTYVRFNRAPVELIPNVSSMVVDENSTYGDNKQVVQINSHGSAQYKNASITGNITQLCFTLRALDSTPATPNTRVQVTIHGIGSSRILQVKKSWDYRTYCLQKGDVPKYAVTGITNGSSNSPVNVSHITLFFQE